MADTSAHTSERSEWKPKLVPIHADDLPHERIEASLPRQGVSPLLLGKVEAIQHVLGTLLVRRELLELGIAVSTRPHQTGILTLEVRGNGRVTSGFVVVAQSSMEPRPIWPMQLPLTVLETVQVDWIAACCVPKMPAIRDLPERPAEGYLLGWLAAEQIMRLPIVTVRPHMGHDFEAKYRQAKNHWLRPLHELSVDPVAPGTGF